MISFRELSSGLRKLDLDLHSQAIAHASLSSFGEVRGGADTVVGALLSTVHGLMMPTFTYKTMITPETGPDGNGITYGSGKDANRMAEFFYPEMPADPTMGVVAETLRRLPAAGRSSHPILSFAGVNVEDALQAQTLDDPLAPIEVLMQQGAWVLLVGVDHTSNTSLHFAEKLVGRKQFTRWALTSQGVRECPGWTGCSDGFQAAAPVLDGITHRVQIGNALVQALPMEQMIEAISGLVRADPLALLCSRPDCERCNAVRAAVVVS
jgi:aminoglycoside 3-N-acetyltransferase